MSSFFVLTLMLGEFCRIYCHSIEDHKAWRLEKGIVVPNTTIVGKTSTVRSIVDCTSMCAMDASFFSIYNDSTTKLCHCNHDLDLSPAISPVGQLVYGFPSLSYVAETSDNGERNVTSTSPESCLELIHTADSSGIFNDFPYLPRLSLYAYCPEFFSHDWIVIQRRQDGSVSFAQLWVDYVTGFGNAVGEFWLGLETIYQITKDNKCELNITMEAEADHPVLSFGYAHYDRFNISGADDNYRLYVAGFTGNVGDCFTHHSGCQFSTIDVDNDFRDELNCANYYQAAWWYNSCHCCSLNGNYLAGNHTSYANGVNWRRPWGFHYSLLRVEMKVRCLFRNV